MRERCDLQIKAARAQIFNVCGPSFAMRAKLPETPFGSKYVRLGALRIC